MGSVAPLPSRSPAATSKPAWEHGSTSALCKGTHGILGWGSTLLQVLPPGTADAPRLHLQLRASSFQHCGGREASSNTHSGMWVMAARQGSAPPCAGTWVGLKRMWE